jgi:hypothetical protein
VTTLPREAPLLDPTLVRQSVVLAGEARLSLIAAGLIGAMELASDLPGEGSEMLREALFLAAVRCLTLRDRARHESASAGEP